MAAFHDADGAAFAKEATDGGSAAYRAFGAETHRIVQRHIGAINGAIIAGNPPERRVERLRAFWEQATSGLTPAPPLPGEGARTLFNEMSASLVAMFGAPGFFTPRATLPWMFGAGGVQAISLYDTHPLHDTLRRLLDFDRINGGETRLTVGAVNVLTGNSTVFDSAEMEIGPEHVMASGALPPGFPPVEIGGEPYWDGGLVSNTPLQFVLDEEQSADMVVLQVDLFNARGPMPRTLMEADEREKDIRYSSRTRFNTDSAMRVHRMKAALRTLLDALPQELASGEEARLLREAAKENAVAVVQMVYRKRPYEGGSKDYEFSRQTMIEHWAAGAADVERFAGRMDRLLPLTREGGVVAIDPGLHDDPEPRHEERP